MGRRETEALTACMRRFAAVVLLALPLLVAGCGGDADSVAPVEQPPPRPPPAPFDYPLDDVLRLNHLQAKGTHNSYHVETEGNTVLDWHYTHAPLDIQLSAQGVRKLELDTRYVAASNDFEVFHLPVLDEQTTCRKFVDCLATLKRWSDRFPAHHPLFVMIEPKDAPPADTAEDYFALMEGAILSVWPRERIVTPDSVKGDAATLREAVTTRGWPALGEVRGKILFFVNNTGSFRDPYTRGGQSLDGRLMFVESSPADPFAAVLILNDASGGQAEIEAGAQAGFLVRTFGDGANDIDPVEVTAALASGAHVISSDHPVPVESGGYSFEIPGGAPSRCNPITAPPECTAEAIEDPAFFTEPYP